MSIYLLEIIIESDEESKQYRGELWEKFLQIIGMLETASQEVEIERRDTSIACNKVFKNCLEN